MVSAVILKLCVCVLNYKFVRHSFFYFTLFSSGLAIYVARNLYMILIETILYAI